MSSSWRFAVSMFFFVPLFLGLSLHSARCQVLELDWPDRYVTNPLLIQRTAANAVPPSKSKGSPRAPRQ